ncbi:uncharacterized protein [Rutidosis leptorrhynchoides]|uniref:uncharacterized protein isoform X2 n=1 Tax=Rutidosis leptorrhynchoides TaxID=125765 RepID=UPI003A992980
METKCSYLRSVSFASTLVKLFFLNLFFSTFVPHQNMCEGKNPKSLILSDLYYHIQGEYEGRKIEHKLFKELFQFLIESNFLETYQNKDVGDVSIHAKDILLFDYTRLEKDLGIDSWLTSDWEGLITVAKTMLSQLKNVNSMMLLGNSKTLALKALSTLLPLYDEDATIGGELSEQQISEFIEFICRSLHESTDSLVSSTYARKDALNILTAQSELLHHYIVFVQRKLSVPSSILMIKTITSIIKTLKDLNVSSVDLKQGIINSFRRKYITSL